MAVDFDVRPSEPTGSSPSDLRYLAAATGLASLLAGALHLAAALYHRDLPTLASLFLLAGLVQVAWAVAMVQRPGRALVAAGAAANLGFAAFYLLTRVVGVPVEGLEDAQAIGVSDLVTTLLEVGAGMGGVVLFRAMAPSANARPVVFGPSAFAAVSVLALLAAVPALAETSSHEHGDHAHLDTAAHEHGAGEGEHAHGAGDEGDDHAHGDDDDHAHGDDGGDHADGDHAHGDGDHADDDHADHADDDHAHGDGDHADGDHAHGDGDHGDGVHPVGQAHGPDGHPHGAPGTGPGGHQHGGDTSTGGGHHHGGGGGGGTGPTWTPAQAAYLDRMLVDTEASLPRFADAAAARAAGFTWIGDGRGAGGYQHWVNVGWLFDSYQLDPRYPESLVYRNTGSGLVLEAAMYMLDFGTTVDTIPADIAWLPGWHIHDNLCFSGAGLTGLAVNGTCARGNLLITPPMMHVWIVDTPCGRFAGVDEGGLQCDHQHNH